LLKVSTFRVCVATYVVIVSTFPDIVSTIQLSPNYPLGFPHKKAAHRESKRLTNYYCSSAKNPLERIPSIAASKDSLELAAIKCK